MVRDTSNRNHGGTEEESKVCVCVHEDYPNLAALYDCLLYWTSVDDGQYTSCEGSALAVRVVC